MVKSVSPSFWEENKAAITMVNSSSEGLIEVLLHIKYFTEVYHSKSMIIKNKIVISVFFRFGVYRVFVGFHKNCPFNLVLKKLFPFSIVG